MAGVLARLEGATWEGATWEEATAVDAAAAWEEVTDKNSS
jgi:hypothetical protein